MSLSVSVCCGMISRLDMMEVIDLSCLTGSQEMDGLSYVDGWE